MLIDYITMIIIAVSPAAHSDFMGPIEACRRVNGFIVPEALFHAATTAVFLVAGYWRITLLNAPLVLYNAYKYVPVPSIPSLLMTMAQLEFGFQVICNFLLSVCLSARADAGLTLLSSPPSPLSPVLLSTVESLKTDTSSRRRTSSAKCPVINV